MDPIKPPGRRERTPWLPLVVILALAVLLRYVGLQWGLPTRDHIFSYHPDEYHSLRGAFSAVLAGDPNPHFFNYGSLYLYLTTVAVVLADSPVPSVATAQAMGRMMHDWTLAARHVTLVLAVLTVLVAYFAARQLVGGRFAILAALAMAVLPLHVLHSHYATVDVPQAFFIALTLLFAVRIGHKAEPRDYVLAGICAGLAASTKYNGAVVLIAPLVAHFAAAPGERRVGPVAWQPLAMLAIAALAFAVTSPYTLLDWGNARRDILFELQHMRAGEEPARSADPNGWLFHGWGLTLTTCGGALVAVLGLIPLAFSRYRRASLGLVVFAFVWFAMISLAQVRYGRYEVALMPVIAILLAAGPAALYGRRAELRLFGVLLPALVIGVSLGTSATIASRLAGQRFERVLAPGERTPRPLSYRVRYEPDPRDVSLLEVVRRVPPGRPVGLVWEPWFNAPPLDPVNGGQVLRHNELWKQFSQPVRPLMIVGLDAQALQREQPFAFVLGNFEIRDALRLQQPGALAFRRTLSDLYLPAAVASREAPLSGRFGWVPPQDWLYAFPEITLYIRKTAAAGPPVKFMPPAPAGASAAPSP